MAQIILPTGTAPASPASGTVTVYSKTSDKKLYYKDDSGTETGPLSSGVTYGTGVATALAVNVGTAGSPVVNGGALGTPSSGTVTNLTGTASININGTVGATTPAAGSFTTATLAAGTAAAPSLTTTGDTNTGVWFPAADTVAVSTGGTERLRIDSSGNVIVTNATGGLGYGTGAGGTVTQATSKATAVTLNKPCGQITMNAASLGSGAIVAFSLNNSLIGVTDVVVTTINFVNGQNYSCAAYQYGGGSCNIWVKNESGGALAEAVVINFAIIKGAAS